MNQKINRAGDVIKLNNFGQTECMAPESINIRLEMAYQPDRNHRLYTNTQACRCDFSVESADNTCTL